MAEVWIHEGMTAGEFVANANATLDSLVLEKVKDIALLSELKFQAEGVDSEAVLHIIENKGMRSLSWVNI